nr:MAG TPA: hypothetical protein [Caudoviricetes sp.]
MELTYRTLCSLTPVASEASRVEHMFVFRVRSPRTD